MKYKKFQNFKYMICAWHFISCVLCLYYYGFVLNCFTSRTTLCVFLVCNNEHRIVLFYWLLHLLSFALASYRVYVSLCSFCKVEKYWSFYISFGSLNTCPCFFLMFSKGEKEYTIEICNISWGGWLDDSQSL